MSERSLPDEATYEIVVAGHLDEDWASWFDRLTIETDVGADGAAVTRLVGPIADQAALHGILAKIRDLGLKIRNVNRIDVD